MTTYCKLDEKGMRIRNQDEVHDIKKDLDNYHETKNLHCIEKYLPIWGELINSLNDSDLTTRTIALILWDETHPLSKDDLERWQKIVRNSMKELHLMRM